MTTYYGVWSGEEWCYIGHKIYRTTELGLAWGQAMLANCMCQAEGWGGHWRARAIGEDGLPAPSLTEEQKQIRLDAIAHKCTICSDTATNWVEMRDRKWYFCDRHEAWGKYVLSDHVRRNPKILDAIPEPRESEGGLPVDAVCDKKGPNVVVTVQTGEEFLKRHMAPLRFEEYVRDFVGRRCMP